MSTRITASALVLAAAWLGACATGSDTTSSGTTTGSGGTGGSDDFNFMLGTQEDPTTCDAAAEQRSYLGCDYWPTVTFNSVWSIFDFAVVVANVGAEPAEIAVSGPQGPITTLTVEPKNLAKIALPWIPELKGADSDTCGQTTSPGASVLAKRAAFHLTSTRPVTVYQFNALEYRGAGGPPGKTWDGCPGFQPCASSGPIGCFSFSNDASILLPTTAMTGNYRVTTLDDARGPTFVAITGTQDGTTVNVQLSATAGVLPGGPVPSGSSFSFPLDAGDVVQIASDGTGDLGGTLVAADRPVQVLAGASCLSIAADPNLDASCDHLEESVQPAETLGRRYVIAAPTGPFGAPGPQRVRIYGNVDGTVLTYPSGAPPNAPTTLGAGEVVDLGILQNDLEITADHEFAVATFLVSSIVANPNDFYQHGDPSQSLQVAVEQFRKSYVFLAPDDYDVSFVDVLVPTGANVTLDGSPLPGSPTPIGASGFGVARVRLGAGDFGAHSISSDVPIGVQVVGYGAFTSYQYPAGLALVQIAPPPIIQ
jgi:hypothetical protein